MISEGLSHRRIYLTGSPLKEVLDYYAPKIEASKVLDKLKLKPKEFELLHFLARHQGIAVSRDLLLERVWEWTYDGNSRTVDVHVRWLREKIEPDPNKPQRIVTVRGIGYRFDG